MFQSRSWAAGTPQYPYSVAFSSRDAAGRKGPVLECSSAGGILQTDNHNYLNGLSSIDLKTKARKRGPVLQRSPAPIFIPRHSHVAFTLQHIVASLPPVL